MRKLPNRSGWTLWTPDLIETLLKLRDEEGLTFSVIAKQMKTTKNAVIGKYRRAAGSSIRKKKKLIKVRSKNTKVVEKSIEHMVREIPANHNEERAEIARAKSKKIKANSERIVELILLLGPSMCKYPIGLTSDPDFTYCYKATAKGKSYCAEHYKLCTNKIQYNVKRTYDSPRARRT